MRACYSCGTVHDTQHQCRPRWAGPRAQALTRAVLERDGYTCRIDGCTEHGPADTADHVIPRAMGGSDDLDNLRAAHRLCNLRRGCS